MPPLFVTEELAMATPKPCWAVCLGVTLLLSGCGNYLVNKVAFQPLPFAPADYEITDARIQEVEFWSDDRVRLHAFYIPYPGEQPLVIFLQGNFGNALQRIFDAWELAKTGVNVLLVGYRGYGRSAGTPSEQGLYRDAAAAIDYAIRGLGYREGDIYLLGRSLGSAVALDAAQHRGIGGLILISPFPSGDAVLRAQGAGWLGWLTAGSPFDSQAKVGNARVPALFVQAEGDQLIPERLSRQLFEAYPSPYKSIVRVPGAGHNDIFSVAGGKLWQRVGRFVHHPRQPVAAVELL